MAISLAPGVFAAIRQTWFDECMRLHGFRMATDPVYAARERELGERYARIFAQPLLQGHPESG